MSAEPMGASKSGEVKGFRQNGDGIASRPAATHGLNTFISTLVSAACRVKRLACRQDRERVIRDAGFDPSMSSKWMVISEGGQLVSSAEGGHSHSLVHQCLRRGVWSWILELERESSGDETTCVGVAVHPVINSRYEDSHQVGQHCECISWPRGTNSGNNVAA